jgi:hypothetical protein
VNAGINNQTHPERHEGRNKELQPHHTQNKRSALSLDYASSDDRQKTVSTADDAVKLERATVYSSDERLYRAFVVSYVDETLECVFCLANRQARLNSEPGVHRRC